MLLSRWNRKTPIRFFKVKVLCVISLHRTQFKCMGREFISIGGKTLCEKKTKNREKKAYGYHLSLRDINLTSVFSGDRRGVTQYKQRRKSVGGFIWVYPLMDFNYFTNNYKGNVEWIAFLNQKNKTKSSIDSSTYLTIVHWGGGE